MNDNQPATDATGNDRMGTAPSEEIVTAEAPTAPDIVEAPTNEDNLGDVATPTDAANSNILGPITLKETFNASDTTITTESGDTFIANNIITNLTISNCKIINNDSASAFLRGTASDVSLTLGTQVVEGDIILDNLSTLNLVLSDSSYYMGIINGGNTAKSVSVDIDATSQLILAGDTYVTTLTNADTTNMNIYSNGYKLYVSGTEVAVNGTEAPAAPEVVIEEVEDVEVEEEEVVVPAPQPVQKTMDYTPFIIGGAAILVIILAVIAIMIHNKKKHAPATNGAASFSPAPDNTPARPDFSQFDDTPAAQPQSPATPQAPEAPTPAAPATPVQPTEPAAPATPIQPIEPAAPATPATPTQPVEPTNGSPINPFKPNA